jgi:hypothetical protein
MKPHQTTAQIFVPDGKPAIWCLPLPDFDQSNLDSVRVAFEAATPCAMGQAWRAAVEPGFAPGQVRIGWREDSLLIFAELNDHDIFSSATTTNQRMWELGDTFEVFLRPDGQTEYIELHVTPNNQQLRLRFASTEALRSAQAANVFDDFLLPWNVFYSATWLQPENQKWFVYAAIPAIAVCSQARIRAGSRWHFSFSRYDYTRGNGEPVVSSTSPHAVADFHRQQEWGELVFATAELSRSDHE